MSGVEERVDDLRQRKAQAEGKAEIARMKKEADKLRKEEEKARKEMVRYFHDPQIYNKGVRINFEIYPQNYAHKFEGRGNI